MGDGTTTAASAVLATRDRRRRRSLLPWRSMLAVLCFASAACGSAEVDAIDPGVEPDIGEELQEVLAERADEAGVPGLAYALVDADGILSSGGHGWANVEDEQPATADSIFHVGSTHKALNALFVATLVHEQLIDWDDPIGAVWPEADASLDPTTSVRDLLTMSAGIPAELEDDLVLEDAEADDDLALFVLDGVGEDDLFASPGSTFEYSNISASLAGFAGAAAADPNSADVHGSYVDEFTDRVLVPLGMDDSTLLISEARASGVMARSYEVLDGEAVELESVDDDRDALAPSGSLKSTAHDMAIFLSLMLNDNPGSMIDNAVDADTLGTVLTPRLEGYAMGWESGTSDGTPHFSHEGAWDGFLSVIVIVPSRDVGLVVLTNAEDAAESLIADVPSLLLDLTDA